MYGRAVPRKYVTRTTVIIAIGVLAFAGVIAAILLSSRPAAQAKPETVHIEIQSMTRAALSLNGRTLGLAPRQIEMPASTTPFEIKAVLRNGRVVTQQIVPDHNQIVEIK
jgi:hypothetical protein